MWQFGFETLDAYRCAVEVARWIRRTEWPDGWSHLRDQAVRASESCVLNIAEGRMRGGKAGRNQLGIALGSAGEVLAVLDLVDLPGGAEQRDVLRRIGLMLRRLQ